ncbi:MAG: hypothetical protein QF473_22755 [Planctomycetota bacterium]|nr:hypothetical protein [Planctomycetota bacterium]MDP6502369.1 hypothetical protein [Planctomycetota bacterium]
MTTSGGAAARSFISVSSWARFARNNWSSFFSAAFLDQKYYSPASSEVSKQTDVLRVIPLPWFERDGNSDYNETGRPGDAARRIRLDARCWMLDSRF